MDHCLGAKAETAVTVERSLFAIEELKIADDDHAKVEDGCLLCQQCQLTRMLFLNKKRNVCSSTPHVSSF